MAKCPKDSKGDARGAWLWRAVQTLRQAADDDEFDVSQGALPGAAAQHNLKGRPIGEHEYASKWLNMAEPEVPRSRHTEQQGKQKSA